MLLVNKLFGQAAHELSAFWSDQEVGVMATGDQAGEILQSPGRRDGEASESGSGVVVGHIHAFPVDTEHADRNDQPE